MTGEVAERRYDRMAVRHEGDQRYHCLASTVLREPCRNLTRWFYIPSNSHLCLSHIRQRVSRVTLASSPTPLAKGAAALGNAPSDGKVHLR